MTVEDDSHAIGQNHNDLLAVYSPEVILNSLQFTL